MWKWAWTFTSLLLISGCGGEKTGPDYIAEIDQWHSERIESLRGDTGWLTLVGLHPLTKGVNSLGASADADVILAAGAPYWLGALAVTDDKIMFSVHPDAEVELLDGQNESRLSSCTLATDKESPPTRLTTGSLVFYVIDRDGKLFLRVKDRKSEVLKSFQGIERFPVDVHWRLTARLDPGPATLNVPNALGQKAASSSPGVLVFEIDGQEYRLTPTGEPGESMFLVFGDETNGKTTYAGGRFLVIDPPANDGVVVLDFNRTYNPPCVFTPFATCPLPALGNMLPVAIEAGEMMWGNHH
ncbi:MAG: DUF1684 domain-containing protein [Candidatus Krumholzibacteria bacterium]|nr:DUF1684 domain-containing protein [Candidatus Krumholzibacteria bacterium]